MGKKILYFSFLLICMGLICNAQITTSNTYGHDSIGQLILPEGIIQNTNKLILNYNSNLKLKNAKVVFFDEDHNEVHSKKLQTIENDETISIHFNYSKLKKKKTNYDISPYSKLKNRTISKVQINIIGIDDNGMERFFGKILVIDHLTPNKITVLSLNNYLENNGNSEGVLSHTNEKTNMLFSEITDEYDIKPYIRKIKNKKIDNSKAFSNIIQKDSRGIQSSPITVTVSGYIYYKDSNGNTKPARAVSVEVWEDDPGSGYSSFDWRGITNSAGYYSIQVTHDDGDSDLELHVNAISANSWFAVSNEYTSYHGDNAYRWIGTTVNNIGPGSVTINSIIDDDRKQGAQLLDMLMTGGYYSRSTFDFGAVQAVWPYSNTAMITYNGKKNLVFEDYMINTNQPDVVYHEFGHCLMYRKNSYSGPNSAGYHSLFGNYSPALCWSEGWATMFSQFIQNDGRYDAVNYLPNRPHLENAKLGEGGTPARYYPANSQDNTSHNEVWVTAALLDLWDTGEPDNGDDPANGIISFNECMSIIGSNNIGSIIDFYEILLNGNYWTQTEKNYASRVMRYNKFTVDLEPSTILYTASLSGPTSLAVNTSGTWNCSVSGGNAPYTYQWYYLYPGGSSGEMEKPIHGVWWSIGTNSSSFSKMDNETFHLKCVVTDASNNEITSNTRIVSINSQMAQEEESLYRNKLLNNYPNPFNPSTTINYSVQNTSKVSLIIYDILGRRVETLVNDEKLPGTYKVKFDANDLGSGIYFFRLTIGKFVETKKMHLIK